MRRVTTGILGLIFIAAMVTGCGAGAKQDARQNGGTAASAPAGKPESPPMATPAPSADKAMPGVGQPAGAGASAPMLPALDRKLILNAQVDVKIKGAEDAIAKLGSAVRGAGGYVQETREQGTKQQGRTITMIMRVPAGKYESIMVMLHGLGEVQNPREFSQDVTAEFLDVEARIKTKQIHKEQLDKLWARSGSIKEMIELEQEIARVTAELESLKGRFQFLSNQIDYSTITATLYEPGVPMPIQAPKTVLERIKVGFIGSVNGVVNFTGNAVVAFATAIPALFYLIILGGLGYGIYRLTRRYIKRPPSA